MKISPSLSQPSINRQVDKTRTAHPQEDLTDGIHTATIEQPPENPNPPDLTNQKSLALKVTRFAKLLRNDFPIEPDNEMLEISWTF